MATTTTPIEPPEALGPQVLLPTMRHERMPSPLGWGAIFAGAFVTLGVWLLLHLFGVGIGLTSIDPNNVDSLRGVGIGTGVWSLIAPLLALFIGGWVAGRTAPTVNTANAIVHAFTVWALTALSAMVMIAMLLGALGRAASTTASTVAGAAQSAGAQVGQVAPSLGIDTNDLVARVNRKLEARGLPPVTADQIKAVVSEVAQRAVRGESIDRESIVAITSKHTRLSQLQASMVAEELQQDAQNLQHRGKEIASQAGATALEVAQAGGKVVLVLAITMIVGLGTSVLGSVIAVRRERREYVRVARRAPVATVSR